MDLEPPFRYATLDDAPSAVDLANLTIEGFAEHLWADLADKGETPREFGLRVHQDFIVKNRLVVADIYGKIAALLIAYRMESNPRSFMPGMHPALQPVMDLHAMVPDSWYIQAVITVPEYRGTGLGSGMMRLAEKLAKASGCKTCSLQVLNTNNKAIRLYKNLGYEILCSKPIVKNGWKNPATDWLLMTKEIN